MKSIFSGILAILLLGVGFVAGAQAEASRQADVRRFRQLDTNRDSRLSEDEFIGDRAGKSRVKARKKFKTLDTNRDERLSFKEFNDI